MSALAVAPSSRLELEDSLEAINDAFYARGWTDGLPIVPPTEERVTRMLASIARDPRGVVAVIPPGQGEATVEKIAANAVMAGCRPEYLPVLLAAIEAMCQPEFNLYALQATTNPGGPMLILNGPVRQALEVNCGHNCLGPGWRANATLGRALRLVLLNLGGATPGVVDKATHGYPGKYTMCFGESEEESPWEPLHQERGLPRDASAVTVMAGAGTTNILDSASTTAEGLLATLAGSMTAHGSNPVVHAGSQPTLILGPEHAHLLAREGMTKAQVKVALWERATLPVADLSPELAQKRVLQNREVQGAKVHVLVRPEDLILVVAGGAGAHSVFTNTFNSVPVTRKIGD